MSRKATVKISPKQQHSFYPTHPWECPHFQTHSETHAYVEASGTWETVLDIHLTLGAHTEAMANFICNLINRNQASQNLLQDAVHVLQLAMDDGLNFATEKAAGYAMANIKRAMA